MFKYLHRMKKGSIFTASKEVINNTKSKDMEILKKAKGWQIEFNGSDTYFVVCSDFGDCVFYTDTLRKAENKFNSLVKCA